MTLSQDSHLLHPDFQVWFRYSSRALWKEQPVYSMMVDMRNPSLIGHCILPANQKILLRIKTAYSLNQAEIRGLKVKSLRQDSKGYLYLTLSPGEINTLQFARAPAKCLHFTVPPLKLGQVPKDKRNLLHFGPGIHQIPGGVLKLKSNQTLHLDEGAVLRGRLECNRVKNVVIRGLGIIDLLSTCPTQPTDEKALKEQAIRIVNSRAVRVEGITVRNPSHYGVLLGQSENIRISHLSVFTHCLWGDGIDSMACSDVMVEHSLIRSSDDCLAVYADRGEFKGAARRHRYRNCTLWADVAHPVMVGVHGKQKPPGRLIEDLRFERLTILRHCEPSIMYQGCLALNCGDFNTIRHVRFTDIYIEDPEAPRLIDLRVFFNPAYNPVPGKAIENINFRNLNYLGRKDIPSVIEGFDRHRKVKNIRIKNLKINNRLQKNLPQLRLNSWAEAPRIV